MRMTTSVLLLLVFTTVVSSQDGSVTFYTSLGNITGFKIQVEGRTVASFLGIPYAKPPVGNLRFAKPEPYGEFGLLDAVSYDKQCPQLPHASEYDPTPNMDEDCLALSIYTTYTDQSQAADKPVMVFIHGGGYTTGTANLYSGFGPPAIQEVIIVTLNYRLGPLGFLSTGDSNLPGNYGLWDQHLAIKWVHDNIMDYGGDPNSVTIFGESAGGSAVMYQMLSPQNDATLFQRVITQSPFVMSLAIVERDPMPDTSLYLATVGCEIEESLVNCLQSKSVSELMNAAVLLQSESDMSFYPISDDGFLKRGVGNIYTEFHKNRSSEHIQNVIGNFLDYDLFGGWNSQEGLFGLDYLSIVNAELTGAALLTNGITSEVLDAALSIIPFGFLPPDSYASIFSRSLLKDYYLQDPMSTAASLGLSEGEKRVETYTRIFGDVVLKIPYISWVQIHSALSTKSSYAYEYDYNDNFAISPVAAQLPWLKTGADHAAEIQYVFGYPLVLDANFTTEEERMLSSFMIKAWANFARTGNPGEDNFSEFNVDEGQNYTRILLSSRETHQYPLYAEQRLWSSLVSATVTLPTPTAPVESSTTAATPADGISSTTASDDVEVVVGSGLFRLTREDAGQLILGLMIGVIVVGALFIIMTIACIVTKCKSSGGGKTPQDSYSMN